MYSYSNLIFPLYNIGLYPVSFFVFFLTTTTHPPPPPSDIFSVSETKTLAYQILHSDFRFVNKDL